MITNHAKVSLLVGDYAVAIPVAIFLGGLWLVRDQFVCEGKTKLVLPACAVLVLVAPIIGLGLEGVAAATALCAVLRSWLTAASNDHGATDNLAR